MKGGWVGTYAPGSSVDVPLAGHGDPPYMVTVHSPSGQILMQLEVTADDLKMAADDRGSSAGSSDGDCGTIRLSVGRVAGRPASPPGRATAALSLTRSSWTRVGRVRSGVAR